ncbi:MAG TPA: YihY/virulence factor BrkB family protein, partial [Methyloceanibacter sp.]|nr:YihY/virulence factor BrkB family protein [Methyloceanibacter sp.]
YVPIVFADTGHSGAYETIVKVGRWPFLALLVLSLLALIYRYGPSRRGAEWRWISVGAIFATTVWLLASFGFSYYVSNFASNYDRMYGSLGAVIILLFWLYLTFFIVLVGAEINAVLEMETAQDTRPSKPGGQRAQKG